jgi:hypothetical protein
MEKQDMQRIIEMLAKMDADNLMSEVVSNLHTRKPREEKNGDAADDGTAAEGNQSWPRRFSGKLGCQ